MFVKKNLLSLLLALFMVAMMGTTAFAADTADFPAADMSEGAIGQTYVKTDGTTIKFINGEVVNPNARAKITHYNGAVFVHDSRWDGNSNGNQAQAETEAYEESDNSIGHRNYTRVRVVNSLIPSNIIEDSQRQWASRKSYARCTRKAMYFEVDFAMRSYWGDNNN